MLGLHLRQQLFLQPLLGAFAQLLDRAGRQLAIAPQHLALARQDVARGAADDGADVEGRGGRHELAVLRRGGLELFLHRVQVVNELAGEMDGADPEMGHRGMRLEAGELGHVALAALVGMHHGHHGRLADDDDARLRHLGRHAGGQRMRAEAADLLVVGEREVDRLLERRLQELRQHGEADGVERLHVAGAAAVVLAVLQRERPRIGDPGLAVHRDDVGMPRQHDAARHVRTDGGEQIGLRAVLVGDQLGLDAMALEVPLHVFDQGEVGIARGGIERHELSQHVDGIDGLSGHGVLVLLGARCG